MNRSLQPNMVVTPARARFFALLRKGGDQDTGTFPKNGPVGIP